MGRRPAQNHHQKLNRPEIEVDAGRQRIEWAIQDSNL